MLCRVCVHTLAQDLPSHFVATGDCFRGLCSQASCSRAGVNCQYALLCLSRWLLGRIKETFCGLIGLGGFADSATPCDCVRRVIGWVSDGGWSRSASMGGAVVVVGGLLSTLESCWGSALTLRFDAGLSTLGAGAGADGAVVCCWIAGGCWMLEKMAWRLSIARICSSVLVGE